MVALVVPHAPGSDRSEVGAESYLCSTGAETYRSGLLGRRIHFISGKS